MTEKERLVTLLEATGMIESTSRCEIVAEELLVKGVILPPCKVGDSVYTVHSLNSYAYEAKVAAIYFTEDKKYYPKPHILIQYDMHRGRTRVNFSEIGKTVFLTREEAEKAIKERSNR